VETVREAIYLGGLITCDGKAGNEISRRIGQCSRLFKEIRLVWSRAAITTKRKMEIYSMCILPKLLYSLESMWMLKAERCRLDAFHCRCLRYILKVPPSYFSRISNAEVLARASMQPLSEILLGRQKKQFWKIAGQSDSVLRRLVTTSTGEPIMWGRRRRGRPRQRWSTELFKLTR